MSDAKPVLPLRFFRVFIDLTSEEIGRDVLSLVLEKAGLAPDWIDPQAINRMDGQTAAEAYARIQQAMRIYYGRGARGLLIRIGRKMWLRFIDQAAFTEKAQARVVRALPLNLRYKATLNFCAQFLRQHADGVTIHTLDLDLMVSDHVGAAAIGQKENDSVCYVTLGLIQEALYWACAREHDIVEETCRARGGDACEFRIKIAR